QSPLCGRRCLVLRISRRCAEGARGTAEAVREVWPDTPSEEDALDRVWPTGLLEGATAGVQAGYVRSARFYASGHPKPSRKVHCTRQDDAEASAAVAESGLCMVPNA